MFFRTQSGWCATPHRLRDRSEQLGDAELTPSDEEPHIFQSRRAVLAATQVIAMAVTAAGGPLRMPSGQRLSLRSPSAPTSSTRRSQPRIASGTRTVWDGVYNKWSRQNVAEKSIRPSDGRCAPCTYPRRRATGPQTFITWHSYLARGGSLDSRSAPHPRPRRTTVCPERPRPGGMPRQWTAHALSSADGAMPALPAVLRRLRR